MSILEWLLPQRCLLCHDPTPGHEPLCLACGSDLPRLTCACDRCALPLPEPGLCGRCQHQPPAFERCFCPLLYREPVVSLITALKFRRRLETAGLLARLIGDSVLAASAIPLPELLIPVPLHPQRLRSRGYNQALLLAHPLARRLSLPLETSLCHRIRHHPAQLGLSRLQRSKNLRGSFEIAGNPGVNHVAIIDDVLTTGSTVDAIAHSLHNAGVTRVDVWVAARVERIGSRLNP
ncbi:MAG: ComF family protein [Gammaproteobacteria bacterium]|nr:ComF family protein [Gammaproteobacteria bacterium]